MPEMYVYKSENKIICYAFPLLQAHERRSILLKFIGDSKFNWYWWSFSNSIMRHYSWYPADTFDLFKRITPKSFDHFESDVQAKDPCEIFYDRYKELVIVAFNKDMGSDGVLIGEMLPLLKSFNKTTENKIELIIRQFNDQLFSYVFINQPVSTEIKVLLDGLKINENNNIVELQYRPDYLYSLETLEPLKLLNYERRVNVVTHLRIDPLKFSASLPFTLKMTVSNGEMWITQKEKKKRCRKIELTRQELTDSIEIEFFPKSAPCIFRMEGVSISQGESKKLNVNMQNIKDGVVSVEFCLDESNINASIVLEISDYDKI